MNRISSGLAGIALIAISACHHRERPEPRWEISSQRLQVQGREELIFTLPENFQVEEPIIVSKPGNASVAELFQNNTGLWTLRYQSADGRAGIDKLSIDSEDEAAERANHTAQCDGRKFPRLFRPHRPKREKHGHFRLNVEISVQNAGTMEQKKSPASSSN
jgi:hypothetical protein